MRKIIITGVLLFLFLGAGGIARKQNFFTSSFPFFLLAAVFLCIPFYTRRSILKVYAQKPDRDMVVTYEITSERVATRSEIASTDIIWRAIPRVIRVPEGFLIYLNDRMFHWLPVHGFQDPADVDRLAELAKSKVQLYESKT